jgi:hypothetical protein
MNLENGLYKGKYMIWHLWDLVLPALTILHFIDLFEHAPLNRKVKILVIDKADEFWVEYHMGTVQVFIDYYLAERFLSIETRAFKAG